VCDFARVRLYRPCPLPWGRGEGDQAHDRFQSTPVGGGTVAFVDGPLSSPVRSLGEEARKLSRVSPFRLWLDRVSGCWGIRISSEQPRIPDTSALAQSRNSGLSTLANAHRLKIEGADDAR